MLGEYSSRAHTYGTSLNSHSRLLLVAGPYIQRKPPAGAPEEVISCSGAQAQQLSQQEQAKQAGAHEEEVSRTLARACTEDGHAETAGTAPLAPPLPASPVVTSVPLLCRESVHAAIKAGKEIGSGGFGHIVLCTLEGMQVVVKRANDNKHADALVAREAFMLSSLAAPLGQPAANIVKVLGVSYAPAKADSTAWQPVLVLEYCSKGSLHDYSRAPDGHIHTALSHLAGAALGLARMHAAGMVHCDFKPANIFIRSCGTAAVADFGLALYLEVRLQHACKQQGLQLSALLFWAARCLALAGQPTP